MMDVIYWLILILGGIASFLLLLGLHEAWRAFLSPRQRLLDERMHLLFVKEESYVDSNILQRRSLSRLVVIDRFLGRVPGIRAFDHFLVQADWPLDVSQNLLMGGLLLIVSALIGMALDLPAFVTGLLMVVILGGAIYYLNHRCTQRVKIIEKQLPDALDLMVRAQQSGHAFTSALQITASETRAPIGMEFRKVFDEINLGMSIKVAMNHLAARIDSNEIRYFVVAVLIQNETGGNLAEVLRKTAALIRERQKIAVVVRVLSAEGRISAWILSVMPFVLALLLYLINPEFISALWKEPMGLTMLGISLCLMIVGVVWMSRLVQIEV